MWYCKSFTLPHRLFPILYCHARPVFIDSEKDTWNIDPDLLEKAIKDQLLKGKKPAAIIAVPPVRMPAKMNEVLAIAGKYEIPVIEDAAEALGSTYHEKACGNWEKSVC